MGISSASCNAQCVDAVLVSNCRSLWFFTPVFVLGWLPLLHCGMKQVEEMWHFRDSL